MFDFFGADTLLAVRFVLAFVVVLALIGVAAWAVRRLGSARTGHAVRGRLPRLGVSDYASVDSRRRLVLVRRDNVEHLVMIGGPTDVVVEGNIAKEGSLSRVTAIVGDPEPAATSARTLPPPEDGVKESWPLQPEYPPSRPRAPRNVADENIPLIHDEFQARLQRGAAWSQESAPLPLAPEPPGDPLSQRRGRSMPPRPPLVEPRAEGAKDRRHESGVPRQQPLERSVSWPSQPERPASPPRAPRNEAAPEEDENNPLMREESQARPWHGDAPLPEPPPIPLAPEPLLDPLSQRRSPLVPRRPPLAEPRTEVAGDHRHERGGPDQQSPERSVSWPPQPEQPAPRPRAPRNEPAAEEHENNPMMRHEPQARPWRAPLPEPPPIPVAPEPPVDPLSQRTSPLAPPRPPLAEPGAEVAGDYRQEWSVPPRHTPERSAVDESLAEMAQRLEATLRKPKSTAPTAPAPAQAYQSKAAAPANPAPYDDLELQMASLLGRSSKKTDDSA